MNEYSAGDMADGQAKAFREGAAAPMEALMLIYEDPYCRDAVNVHIGRQVWDVIEEHKKECK